MNIAAQLSEIACYGEFFAITVGGDATGWRAVQRCYADGCGDLIDTTADRYRTTDRRIGASTVQLSHATRLWSPVLACALAHGILPDLTYLYRKDDGTALRLAEAVAAPVAPTADALYQVVVQQHLEPMADGLRIKLARGLLYGNAASALVAASRALIAQRPDLRDAAVALTESLLATGKLAGTGTIVGSGLRFRRRSCCLYYRVSGGAKCHDCGLTKTAEAPHPL
ncbi:(2Fe-2S)-binding protein [Mycolicibacterium pulveris]|uniref:(2Fe-2S)-binding protein n=1 Tax=Mycolicibacterium pulveris TaxID=36813 RepID=UPI003CFA4861